MTLKSYTHSPKSGKKPENIVILLHGLGANGADLIDLAGYWEQALPDTVFVSPDAPFPCDMAPYGFQWFSLQSRAPAAMLEGIETAVPILNRFIDETLEQYGLADEKLALAGFSQGTMMSLYTAPRRAKRIAGVLGYSGALLGAESLREEGVHKIPVRLIHGDADPVVPVEAYHMAKAALEGAGFTVSGGVTRGLPHSIDMAGIESGGAFLKEILA
ncbi:MAG: dienelactone hydrolase family protein [Micavibrio sp.]